MLVTNFRVLVLCLRSFRNFGIGSVRRCSRKSEIISVPFDLDWVFLTSESWQDWIDLFYFHFWVMASPHRNIFMWQATHLSCRKAAIRQTTRKMAVTRPMLIFVSAKNQENVNCLKSLERT